MKLQRYAGNPILSPHPDHAWEDLAVFNPAAYYDEEKRQVLLLYRAAESHPEYKCYFGLATSSDGYHFERASSEPVLSPSVEGFDGATIQDPRIIKMGDWFYVTYACRHYPFGQFWIPGGRDRYCTPDCPPDFPALSAKQCHAHRPGDDAGFQELDARGMADRSAAGRPRRDSVSGEDPRQIRDDAPARWNGSDEAYGTERRRAPGSPWPTTCWASARAGC